MRRSSVLSVVVACLFLMGGMAFGQVAPIDFEAGGNGADWTWTVFENGTNPAVAIIANPNAAGLNTSATVAEFTALDAGMDWAGTENLDIGEFTFDATNSTVKVMVHKAVMSDFRIKFEGASAPVEINIANTLTGEWEELTYDFSGVIGNTYNKLVIFPDFAPRDQDNVIYFDNITFSAQMVPMEPMAAAPAPMQDAADVMSIYSGAYDDLPATNFNPDWGQSTVVTVDADVAGDGTLLYETLNYQGTNLGGPEGVDQDFSGYDFIHIDFWTANAPALNFFLISRTTGEQAYTLPITPGEWVSIDIPLTHFTDLGLGLTDIFQFKVDGGDGATKVWFDNWYFFNDLPTEPMAAAPVPMHDPVDVMSIYSGAYDDLAATNFNPNWGQSTVVTVDADVAGDATLLYETLNYQGTNLGGPEGVDQDVSGYQFFHVDFWTSNAPALNFFLISRTTGEQAFSLPIVAGEWVSIDIPLAHFTDLGLGLTDIFQFKVDGGDGATNVWFDNWYFHGEAVVEPDPGLFFSEYTEGNSGNNKYVEIYNPTDVEVDLSAYTLKGSNNGSEWGAGGDRDTTLSGMLAPGEVFVIAADGANADILAQTDLALPFPSPVHHNGNDGIALFHGEMLIDAIGVENVDPGVAWDVAGVLEATKDHTLIRKDDVMYGNIGNWAMSAGTDPESSQWIVADPAGNEFTPPTLGWHILPPPPPAPLVAAPAAIHDPADVMSIYSAAYDDLAETNFNPNWGQSTVVTTNADIAGDTTHLLYEGLNYQGTNLGGPDGVDQNVAGYQFIHIDFWTSNAPALNFFLISRSSGEQAFSLPIVPGEWVSLDIPLSYFTDLGMALTDIFQFKVDGGDGATNVWFDNWYFHTPVPPPPPPIELAGAWVMAPQAGALAVGPNPFDGSWWANSEDDVLTRACFFDDKYVFNADGSFHNMLDGETWLETWQGVDADGCGAPVAPHDGMTPATWSVDPETRTVTLDGVGSYLGIPKAFNGGELGNPADAPASITYEIHLDDNNPGIAVVLDIGGGFWTFKMVPAPPMPPPVPLVAAPTPTIDEAEVFSIFSDAYADLAETNFNPDWGQSTEVMMVDIAGDPTLAYALLNYQGTNLGGPEGVDQDVSGYDFIHVDLWTANATELNFFLISRSSGEQAYSLPITPQEWVSVDIPLSYFTDLGMVVTDIFQFKVDGGNGETMVWFDNWFFHTLNTTSVDENLIPEEFALSQNYPNPFNPSTTIDYSVAEAGHVTLKIYNITGQEVVTVVDEMVSPGYYSTYFDASNLATGTYFYALTAGKERSVKKMVLIK